MKEARKGIIDDCLLITNHNCVLDVHATYLDGLKDLENMRRKMIDDGQLFREYQKQVTDHQFQLEIYQAEEEYLVSFEYKYIYVCVTMKGEQFLLYSLKRKK